MIERQILAHTAVPGTKNDLLEKMSNLIICCFGKGGVAGDLGVEGATRRNLAYNPTCRRDVNA